MPSRKDASPTGRKRLGRGLTSLMSSSVPVSVPPADSRVDDTPASAAKGRATDPTKAPPEPPPSGADSDTGILMLPLDEIERNPDQPRQDFDEKTLQELAASIRTAGLMQPIVVRPVGGAGGGPYQIVVGERRFRAARLAGLDRLPAIVRELDEQAVAEWAIIENLQREDLNPLERADAFRRLADQFGLTHQEVADRVGLNRSTVTNLLRLHELDEVTKEAVRRGQISQAQARILLAVTNLDARHHLVRLTMREGWSVRTLEKRANALTQRSAGRKSTRTSGGGAAAPHRADLERRLADHLGTKVQVQPGKRKGSGRLIIDFFSFDQFEGLMQKLGFDTKEL